MESLTINQICRTCKCVAPHMRSLFEGYENPHQSPRIDEMLMACASVQVTCGDGLPTLMCQMCVEQLKNAYLFKRQAEKIDVSLREYAKTIKVNEIKEELQNSEFMESLNTLNNLLSEESTSKDGGTEGQPQPAPKIETDYIQIMDNNQMLLTCRECAKIFTTLEGLRCHKRIHSGGMYKCKQCDKEYTRLNHLQRHEQSHNRRKVHVCRICSKTLTRMEHLKRHLVTHLREKPFSCKTCNRGFNRIEHLHNHAPRCKGDTVYPCDICNKAFNREDSLEVHKKMHDNKAPKLPTIESLDNIEDHYYQIDQDINDEAAFSDHDDEEVDDCFEPQVEVTESVEEEKIEIVADIDTKDDDSNVSDGSLGGDMDDMNDMMDSDDEAKEDNEDSMDKGLDEIIENEEDEEEEEMDKKDVKVEEGAVAMANEDVDELVREAIAEAEAADVSDKDSDDSDYVPKKTSPKGKRGRGRPRKNPEAPRKPKKTKVPGRGRGRPPSAKTFVKKEKEEEEYGDFPCPICGEMCHSLMQLDRHARIKHEGMKDCKMSSRTSRRKRGESWTEEGMRAAITAVQKGQLTQRAAITKYNIPRRTFRNHLKVGSVTKRLGRKPILTDRQESDLAAIIKRFAEIGVPLTPEFIRKQAFLFCERYEIPNNFNETKRTAGADWLKQFLKRNPSINEIKSKIINPTQAQKLNKPIVEQHFQAVKKLYNELDILRHPERLYYMDDKGCHIALHKQQTVLADKEGRKVAPELAENVIIALCANAIGTAIPPMILFEGQTKRPDLSENLPAGTSVRMAPTGNMTSDLFVEFIDHLGNFKVAGKCLLVLDGAKCHLSSKVLDEADKNDIVLYCLPPNTTHELQPLGKSVNDSYEHHWDEAVMSFLYANADEKLTKTTFSQIFSQVWPKCMTHSNIIDGFKATGLFPFNPEAISKEAYAQSISS